MRGVTVWLRPQPPDVQSRTAHNERVFLETTLDTEGCKNYYRVVNFMKAKVASVVDGTGWYLSISPWIPPRRVRARPETAGADHC